MSGIKIFDGDKIHCKKISECCGRKCGRIFTQKIEENFLKPEMIAEDTSEEDSIENELHDVLEDDTSKD